MGYQGKIVIGPFLAATGNSIVVHSPVYPHTAQGLSDRDAWLDSHDLTTELSSGQFSSSSAVQMQCYKIDTLTNVPVAHGSIMLAGSGSDALSLDRSTRTNYQPIIIGLWGQSNQVGHGVITDLAAISNYPAASTKNRIFNYSNAYVFRSPAADPIDSATNQVDSVSSDVATAAVGPGLGMADAIVQSRNTPVILVPAARDGTTIANWARGSDPLDRTTLYGSGLYRLNSVCTALGCSNAKTCMVWYQGESDAVTGAINTWQSNVASMFASLRSDIGLPNMPIFVVKKSTALPSFGSDPGWTTLRNAQAALDDGSKTWAVDEPDGPWTGDEHLATAGQLTLGAALGAAYLAHY